MADQNIATIPLVSTADGADRIVVIRGGAPVQVPASVLAPAAPAAEVTQAELDAVATVANAALPATQKGAANGLAPLDGTGKVPAANLPASTSAVNVQSGALVASPTDAPNASAVIDAVSARAVAITASAIVPNGTSLSRTATAGAATGHYNRPLYITEDKVVSSVGAVDSDQVYAFNDSAVPRTLTVGSVVATIPAKSWGELTRAGGVWYDTSATAGTASSYTDAQARAAAVLPGALGTSTTQAPTHAAVADAIAGAGAGALPVMPISSATSLTLTKAAHGGKRVEITMTAQGQTVIVDVSAGQSWTDGDLLEIVNASAQEFSLRSSTYSGLYPAESKPFAGENTFVRYRHNGTRFEAVDASFLLTQPSAAGGRKTAVWFGAHGTAAQGGAVEQRLHYSGDNMDWSLGNGMDDMQINLGGYTFYGSPSRAWRGISTTIYKIKPATFPTYAQQAAPVIGLTLGYYEDAVQDKMMLHFQQSGVHNNDATSRAANPLPTDQGERNWVLYRGAPLTISIPPPSTAHADYASKWSGGVADFTERGTLLLRQAFGIASEFVDDGAAGSTHTATIPAGVSNVLLNKGGALTLALPLVEGEEKSRDMRCSVIAAHTSIALTGTTVALGTLPLTAGSFFTLRWSPALAAWHRIG